MDEFDYFNNFENELDRQIDEKLQNYDFLNYNNIIKKTSEKKITYLQKNSPFDSLNKIFQKKTIKKNPIKNIEFPNDKKSSENQEFDLIEKYESHIKSKNISKK